MELVINKGDRTPFYTQIQQQIESLIQTGQLAEGEILPSMNVLASCLGVSKETVKKTYSILVKRGFIEPRQGKGFFVSDVNKRSSQRILFLMDRNGIYKQMMLDSFQSTLARQGHYDLTLLIHNQSVELLRYFLDNHLDRYDWYVVMPHFPLDDVTQENVLKQLRRIPNRKMILLDRLVPHLPGNFGSVYQDYDEEVYQAMMDNREAFRSGQRLWVLTRPTSMYKSYISQAISRFCQENGVELTFISDIPDHFEKQDIYMVLSNQHDYGFVDLVRRIERQGLKVGEDIFLVAYNDIDLNELVLGGLSVFSTDFRKMGQYAAEMIVNKQLSKIHNDFALIRRKTF